MKASSSQGMDVDAMGNNIQERNVDIKKLASTSALAAMANRARNEVSAATTMTKGSMESKSCLVAAYCHIPGSMPWLDGLCQSYIPCNIAHPFGPFDFLYSPHNALFMEGISPINAQYFV